MDIHLQFLALVGVYLVPGDHQVDSHDDDQDQPRIVHIFCVVSLLLFICPYWRFYPFFPVDHYLPAAGRLPVKPAIRQSFRALRKVASASW